MMTTLTSDEFRDFKSRYPDVFHRSFFKRFGAPVIGVAVAVYLVFAWSFFSIGTVISGGNWDIAGAYLADWISYEARPDIEYRDGWLDVSFMRYSPLGSDPHPDWLTTEKRVMEIVSENESTLGTVATQTLENSFMTPGAKGTSAGSTFMAPTAPRGGSSAAAKEAKPVEPEKREVATAAFVTIGNGHVEIIPGLVTLTRGGETVTLDIEQGKRVEALDPLPSWATQKLDGGKVVARFGFAGRVEVENDEVKVRRRFLGWENFWFDTRSPFWGKSFGEVVSLVMSSERIDPAQSNLHHAIDDFLYNSEWQHADVWIKLLQTIVMAFVGTLFATVLAFPLSFAAARNITSSRVVNQVSKRFFDFLRSVDMLIWALFFTRAFGPGPLAGMSAIFFTDTGTLGKLYSEALENIDDRQREGVRSMGASPLMVKRFGIVPQVLPVFISQSLYFWESNTRSATIIGAVGAGGIGLKLWEAMRTNQDWENVAYMVLLILVVVYIFDNLSNLLRSSLIGEKVR